MEKNQAQSFEQIREGMKEAVKKLMDADNIKADPRGNFIIKVGEKDVTILTTFSAIVSLEEKFGSLDDLQDGVVSRPTMKDLMFFIQSTSDHGLSDDELGQCISRQGYAYFTNVIRIFCMSVSIAGTEGVKGGK